MKTTRRWLKKLPMVLLYLLVTTAAKHKNKYLNRQKSKFQFGNKPGGQSECPSSFDEWKLCKTSYCTKCKSARPQMTTNHLHPSLTELCFAKAKPMRNHADSGKVGCKEGNIPFSSCMQCRMLVTRSLKSFLSGIHIYHACKV
jgi:hypothetical protein